jgi:hypothetical protein
MTCEFTVFSIPQTRGTSSWINARDEELKTADRQALVDADDYFLFVTPSSANGDELLIDAKAFHNRE